MKQGKLFVNEIGRYAIDEHTQLHCGDVVELSLDGVHWFETAIEHADCYNGYYAVENPDLNLKGLYCRIKGWWLICKVHTY